MFGEIHKKIIGVCKTCGLPVYSYTSDEKYKYFETRYTCEHKNGYIVKDIVNGQFIVSSDVAEKIIEESKEKDNMINNQIKEYIHKLYDAKEKILKACLEYNQFSEISKNEVISIRFYNKDSQQIEEISIRNFKEINK